VQQRIHDAATKRELRNNAIDVLIGACDYNAKLLDSMKALTLKGEAMRNPDLRITTWDAVGPVFAPVCSDPHLLQILSHHWLRLHRIERLSEDIFMRDAGILPAFSNEKLMLKHWGVLHESAQELAAHAREMIERLEKLKATAN